MVKIVKRESCGIQPVYDIGVSQDHNFLIKQGLIASNCFNKSHSTAYAYITYQTAYLKANYPVEYMSALLTASSDNQEKVEKYRENCQKMGIEVQPPDINRSQRDFTPSGDTIILFGLSAVRNLGEGAIENILNAREAAGGSFKSLGDFCTRVDLRTVNRRALETLIYCGGFDSIKSNRQQLINDLEVVISWAQTKAKEQASGQTNLFDLLGNNNANEGNFDQEPTSKPVEDFPLDEKLRLEKENLGFYVSEHPLKSLQKSARLLSPINLEQLPDKKAREKVSTVVIINNLKKIMTKKGEPMAFIQLEDVSGQAEGVVFPSIYKKIEANLQVNNPLIVWGQVEHKDEQSQLIIDDIQPVEIVKIVIIDLDVNDALDNVKNNNLKGIIQEQSGDKTEAKIPVIARLKMGNESKLIRFGQNFWVQNAASLAEALTNAGFAVQVSSLT
ncbi:MAG: trans-splicing intein-formed DNA polymerase III subunit alpha C-terminal partner DnaE-C [Gloeocapsa sp. DLM2.Bin57]|nr:MAG: trans-splicing intein-formed DNA polymerase III subunit alpha C-terminal partner DnaE-C [Gloeocapsa sp. DLM2.Bin57]